jgi:hypothetical protein
MKEEYLCSLRNLNVYVKKRPRSNDKRSFLMNKRSGYS